jgi:hypothetical protein
VRVRLGLGSSVCGFSHDVVTTQVHKVQNQPIDTIGWGRVGFPRDPDGTGEAVPATARPRTPG